MSARARPDDGRNGTRSRPILLPLDVSSRWIAAHLRSIAPRTRWLEASQTARSWQAFTGRQELAACSAAVPYSAAPSGRRHCHR